MKLRGKATNARSETTVNQGFKKKSDTPHGQEYGY